MNDRRIFYCFILLLGEKMGTDVIHYKKTEKLKTQQISSKQTEI
jgi:hypothetical protein